MYLSKVEIKNFRSLKDITLDLQPGLNVVVGRNNVGKTNVLHAIRHAVGPEGARGETAWLDEDDFYHPPDGTDRATSISISLTYSNLTEEQRARFFEIVDFDLSDLSKSKAIVRYEASWPSTSKRPTTKRTGGPDAVEPPEVPGLLLGSLPITYLPALRDAEAALAPGQRSRLAQLFRDLIQRSGGATGEEIKGIFQAANQGLEDHTLIETVKASLQVTTRDLAGSDYSPSVLRAAEAKLERILRTLQVQMDGAAIPSLDANGLGYNNLLYIAVVLEHLKTVTADECPLLLVEEPEAHLHPQLTELLAGYLANNTPGTSSPQTIVTTHSPVLASRVRPNSVHVMFADHQTRLPRCNSVANACMTPKEERQLQRMLDITRASIYFAKGVVLVEGISESLLIPTLAKRQGIDLGRLHITVMPICGVSFETFSKLLQPTVFDIPVAIVTDGDPTVNRGEKWDDDVAEVGPDGEFVVSDRTTNLVGLFPDGFAVKVFHSKLTLEYDLAIAGDGNSVVMAKAWEACFAGTPGTFNLQKVAGVDDLAGKALIAWRGICRANHTGSKAEFAHMLAAELEQTNDKQETCAFDCPKYISGALEHVIQRVDKLSPELGKPSA
jgi:putative ATP-dependent endonuclease of the OLD family